ncbi:ATP synthase subunit I [Ramlibacter rhizophilus]|uniref:ATP synthase subunit I n=1 Tax=Ramlibacter rhizophilus TaxID=1781167 RepID=A0A4Z0BAX8_9BURK|nr:ATP synthase subunit I [Ramlibacter rhizophilus]TFY96222.1 ATP synthase subunit I [Ramlibacter rhizophilus]
MRQLPARPGDRDAHEPEAGSDFGPDAQGEPEFVPLSPLEAQRLRERLPRLSPWRIVAAQLGIGLLVAGVAGGVSGRWGIAASVLYGAWAIAIPAALYARALGRAAGAGVLAWELVKVGLSVALLAAAPKLVPDLNWLALLAGVILATKMYWVAFAFARRPQRRTWN